MRNLFSAINYLLRKIIEFCKLFCLYICLLTIKNNWNSMYKCYYCTYIMYIDFNKQQWSTSVFLSSQHRSYLNLKCPKVPLYIWYMWIPVSPSVLFIRCNMQLLLIRAIENTFIFHWNGYLSADTDRLHLSI